MLHLENQLFQLSLPTHRQLCVPCMCPISTVPLFLCSLARAGSFLSFPFKTKGPLSQLHLFHHLPSLEHVILNHRVGVPGGGCRSSLCCTRWWWSMSLVLLLLICLPILHCRFLFPTLGAIVFVARFPQCLRNPGSPWCGRGAGACAGRGWVLGGMQGSPSEQLRQHWLYLLHQCMNTGFLVHLLN